MIATTQEQSQRLLCCGVSADTADMIGVEPDYDYVCEQWSLMQGQDTRGYFPAWSLSALLGLLPKEIGIAVGAYPGSDKYTCFTLIDPDIEPIVAYTVIESIVQMIEQLTKDVYKLNDCPCREKGGENE